MRFVRSEEQRQLAASVHDLLAAGDVPAAIRAWGRGEPEPGLELVRRLAKIGVTGLAVPERFDGLGAGPVDLVVVFEELGRHAVPGPLVESFAAVPTLLAGVADAGRWLPGLAAGDILATLALPPHVPYALDADVAVAVFLVDGDTVHTGSAGAPVSSVDATRKLFPVDAAERIGPGDVARAFEVGVLCGAAQLLGLGRGLLAQASAYVKQRKQFGRAVGEFQAVKHHLADVLVALEFARPLVHAAAVTGFARDVSAARVAAADAAYRAARAALQVHGAVGYTLEYDLGLWLTKVRALRSAWGTQSWHRERVLAALSARRRR
ncbi:MAG: acyl-CoA dehydrogenase [Actinophytocola sp.]|uniref:acyl-CoA dehydrogenase family protein n=1 Tax=Actinophytocola sp. TaxID=1872138 RepID=UPI0013207F94|nr:acyl-CoA dehydrogenase family protein [Actinophytocola sp.]MPZ80660.1 acyl-CoA dehydrogenase [Actinophytocola sp.]